MEEGNFYKAAFFTLLVVVAISFFSGLSFFWGRKTANEQSENSQIPEPTIKTYTLGDKTSDDTEVIRTPSPTTEPVVVDDRDLVKQSVLAKTKLAKDEATIAITLMNDSFAKGSVKVTTEVGGGYFLATKVGTKWITTYSGQSTPLCAEVDPFNYPKTFAPECLDSAGSVITRK